MSRPIPRNELSEILSHLHLLGKSVSLNEINQSLKTPLPKYTLQRRLALLIKNGEIKIEGKARARRYLLSSNTKDKEDSASFAEEPSDQIIPLSKDSKTIQAKLRNPYQVRKPVGYNRKFLDEYRPNVTYYLSKMERKNLFQFGKTDGEQPAGTYAREIYNRLLVELSWNSSRLEGNTYSLLETERLLELSEAAEGKNLTDTQMILNHKDAIEFLVESAEKIDIDRYTVLNVHALLSNNLLKDPGACGRLRSKSVGIKKSVYRPLVIPEIINECFDQVLDTAKAINDPFEQAFFLMVHLPYLQPFEDVNKRVSRLVANIPLIRLNLSPLSFMDVPRDIYTNGLLAVYELNDISLLRDVFMWAYERSCALYSVTRQNLGEPDQFRMRHRNQIYEVINYIVREHLGKKEAIALIKLKSAQNIPEEDQSRFIEIVELELRGLHAGNIARYKLRPSEYEKWNNIWNS